MAEAHDKAVRRVRCDLQTLWQGLRLEDEAVISACGHRLRQTLEEAAAVVVDRRLVAMNRRSAHDASSEVLTDRLMAQADPQNGQLLWGPPETLHRGVGRLGMPRTWAEEETCRLKTPNRSPIRAGGAHDFDLCTQLKEELGEVEGERVPVVEDDNNWGQDAQRGLSRKPKAKKPLSRGSHLARGHLWNKVPR